MLCPACKTPLTMSERQGIEIDYCQSCRGVWLDRGELDKIIERSATEPETAGRQLGPPQTGSGHGYNHGHGHHRKRRKTFLENLFD